MDGFVHDQIRELDVLVVGTGFGGIYMLHKLHNDLGLDAVAIDKAAGVGGTWYWNKYPGALSDSESFVYQYSFDRELYEQTPWTTKFVRQPEILEYLNGVVDRYGLREHIQLADRHDRRRVGRGFRDLDCSHRPGRHLRMQVPRHGSGARCLRQTSPSCPEWRRSRAAWCIPAHGPRTWI